LPAPEVDETYYNEQTETFLPLQKGLWYSNNSGQSWQATSTQPPLPYVSALAVGESGDIFAGTSRQSGNDPVLYRSTDAGVTWADVGGFTGKGSITSIAVRGGRVYVSFKGDGIYYRDNINVNGSWCNFENNDIYTQTVDWDVRTVVVDYSISDGTVAYAISPTSLYRRNGGTSVCAYWQDINTGIAKVNTQSVAPVGTTVFAVSKDKGGISRSVSGVWTSTLPPNNDADNRRKYQTMSSEYVFVDPANINKVYTMGKVPVSTSSNYKAVLFRTTNTGSNWLEILRSNSQSSEYSFYGFAADPKDALRRYVVGKANGDPVGGGSTIITNYFRTIDGNTWYAIPRIDGTPTNPAFSMAIDPTGTNSFSDNLYSGLQNAGVYRSEDAGANWASSLSDKTIRAVSLNPSLPNYVYAGGDQNSGISMWRFYKPTNTWSNINGPNNVTRILMHPSYPTSVQYVWIVSDNATKIKQTTNGGAIWNDVSLGGLPQGTIINDLRSDPTSNRYIYAATSGGVYKIDPAPQPPSSIKMLTETVNGFPRPKIWWSPSNVESDLQAAPFQVHKYRWHNGIIDYGVIATVSTNSYVDVSEITGSGSAYHDTAYYYITVIDIGNNVSDPTATVKSSVYGEDEPGMNKPSVGSNQTNIPEEFSLSQNYPNPFNPATEIKYALPVDASVSLKVFDIFGREVATLVSGNNVAGYYSVEFDALKVSSGMYFYRLTATGEGQSFTQVRKMILMK